MMGFYRSGRLSLHNANGFPEIRMHSCIVFKIHETNYHHVVLTPWLVLLDVSVNDASDFSVMKV